MHKIHSLLAAFTVSVLAAGSATSAPRWVQLGMPLNDVQASYPRASRVGAAPGPAMLEMKNVAFGGARWETVDFIFNAAGRLERVQLITRAESFEHLRARLYAQTAPPAEAAATGEQIMDFDSTIQARICDRGADGVYLTYERPSEAI